MPRDDFHRCFVERNIKQIGRFSRKRYDIGSHPRGFGVDIKLFSSAAPARRRAEAILPKAQCWFFGSQGEQTDQFADASLFAFQHVQITSDAPGRWPGFSSRVIFCWRGIAPNSAKNPAHAQ